MPFYRFACRNCGFEKKKLTNWETAQSYKETCPTCSSDVTFAVGNPSAIGKETKDEYRGISSELDVKERLLERSQKHFYEHEIDRIIAKEGKEYAIRQGWLNEDGTKKK